MFSNRPGRRTDYGNVPLITPTKRPKRDRSSRLGTVACHLSLRAGLKMFVGSSSSPS